MIIILDNQKKLVIKLFLLIFFVLPLFGFAQESCPFQTIFSSNSATLVGEIRDTGGDPNITTWFEWGTTSSLTNQTTPQNIYVSYTPFRFCTSISNLQPCTTYYYRAVARNSAGTNLGEIFSFRTKCLVNKSPVAVIEYSPLQIQPGTKVTFSAIKSYDPDGYIKSYAWKVNGVLESDKIFFDRVLAAGTYRIELVVTDDKGDSDNKEIIISVGRNVFRTKVQTKTITQTRTVYVPRPVYLSANNLASLLLEDSYQVKKCSPSDINLTLINNTSVKRKITLEAKGEAGSWFEPQEREFILDPKERMVISWKIYPPCQLKSDKYQVTFSLTTPGFTKDYQTTLEIKSSEANNPLSAFAFMIFNNFPWFLVFVLMVIISVLLVTYYTYRKTSE